MSDRSERIKNLPLPICEGMVQNGSIISRWEIYDKVMTNEEILFKYDMELEVKEMLRGL